ncbi:hypothetical protein LEP1GSC108_4611 [Leptospira weilii str. UI 13098]|uniref:Uncharacterized protein n=1 Tax=Leptospira weilii str. UI 13098 TaxID=1088542 RepID=M6QIA0_9LEPT|nr:hypothetical protein LEP1GSC108_4611 [Leptospira weilii str. UI 13098]
MLPILFFFSFLSDFGDSSFCLSGIQKPFEIRISKGLNSV